MIEFFKGLENAFQQKADHIALAARMHRRDIHTESWMKIPVEFIAG